MDNIINISPEKFALTPQNVSRRFLISLFTAIIFGGLLIFISFSKSGSFHTLFGIILPITLLLSPFINRMFSRFSTNVYIDKKHCILNVDYLNGFGIFRKDSINIKNAMVRYTRQNKVTRQMQVRITQNIFNNWIIIDETHGFSAEQIKFIYETLKDNRISKIFPLITQIENHADHR
ncbi:MAG TPA: hypothetical protein VK787_12455 [Puia sp.]|nr:hypothetical protein [Puia sp.]